MYNEQENHISLSKYNRMLASSGIQNRVRRVHREEAQCGDEILVVGLRFDFVIEAPRMVTEKRLELQLKIISSQLKTKVRGMNEKQTANFGYE